jgi:hypothetical protein
MFTEICLAILLVISSTNATSQKSNRVDIKFGKFSEIGKMLEYDLFIRKDSSFLYVKRYEWPLEFTVGTWKIDKKILVLRSIADTSDYNPSRGIRTGVYIMFQNERYKIRRNSLLHIGNRPMRLLFRSGIDHYN